MFTRLAASGLALILCAQPALAQWSRGLVEFSTYGQYSVLSGKEYTAPLGNVGGVGLAAAVFLNDRFQLSAEGTFHPLDDEDPFVRDNDNYVPLYARANYNVPFGNHSVLLGGGIVRSDFGFIHNWGPSALVGLRVGVAPQVMLRLDGILDYLPTPEITNTSFRAGLSWFRRPGRLVVTEARGVVEIDTLALERERARIAELEAANRRLRDSLAAMGTIATTEERDRITAQVWRMVTDTRVYFDTDRANIRTEEQPKLDALVPVFQANPEMRVQITGYADPRASVRYNLELGMRRANSAREYLVARGVSSERIDIVSFGEGLREATAAQAQWQEMRRAEFDITEGGLVLVMTVQ